MTTPSLLAIAALLIAASNANGNEPQLLDEEVVFEAGYRQRFPIFKTHLGPNGRYLVYVKKRTSTTTGDYDDTSPKEARYGLVLRDLIEGTDTVVPAHPWEDTTAFLYSLKTYPFDTSGTRLVLPDLAQHGEERGNERRGNRKRLVIYSLRAGKISPIAAVDNAAAAMFGPTGAGLLVTRGGDRYMMPRLSMKDDGTLEMEDLYVHHWTLDAGLGPALNIRGRPRAICPTDKVMAVEQSEFWDEAVRTQGKRLSLSGSIETPVLRSRLVLYDFQSNRQGTTLPLSGTLSSRWGPHWTASGRYLYYTEVANPFRFDKDSHVTRIWDCFRNKEVGSLRGLVAVGPGPLPASMVMAEPGYGGWQYGIALHDAKSGNQWQLCDRTVRLFNARGEHVLYIKGASEAEWGVYLARISTAGTRSTRPHKRQIQHD
jgi:hypothetical protein